MYLPASNSALISLPRPRMYRPASNQPIRIPACSVGVSTTACWNFCWGPDKKISHTPSGDVDQAIRAFRRRRMRKMDINMARESTHDSCCALHVRHQSSGHQRSECAASLLPMESHQGEQSRQSERTRHRPRDVSLSCFKFIFRKLMSNVKQ